MLIRKKRNKTIKKINLIPILDAVFIFIFFLLMSAQFVNIHEIATDAPVVSVLAPTKEKKHPLNLVLDINSKSLVIKTGVEGHIHRKTPKLKGKYNLEILADVLIKIKTQHMEERSIIMRPKANISYDQIILIMDSVRNLAPAMGWIEDKNKQGELIESKSLFQQIIFETII